MSLADVHVADGDLGGRQHHQRERDLDVRPVGDARGYLPSVCSVPAGEP